MANLETHDVERLSGMFEAMDESALVKQQCSMRGAIHAIEFLAQHGSVDELSAALLINLRHTMNLLEQVVRGKGYELVFDAVTPIVH